MRQFIRKIWIAVLAAVLILSTAGCSGVLMTFSGEPVALSAGQLRMSEAECRLIALAYKARFDGYYSALLGKDFWQTPVGGLTYEEYVKEYFVYYECRAILYLESSNAGRDVNVTDEEEERLRDAAKECLLGMTEDEKAFFGGAEETVFRVLRHYYAANKTAEKLIEDMRIQVSDEEARVVDVEVIRTDSEEKALEIHRRIEDGENFLTVAMENTLDGRSSYTVARGDLRNELENTIFSMEENEVSGPVGLNGSWYVFRLKEARNVLLSNRNKLNILSRMRFDGWNSVIGGEKAPEVKRNERIWSGIRLNGEMDDPYFDLFRVFS